LSNGIGAANEMKQSMKRVDEWNGGAPRPSGSGMRKLLVFE